ncbi:MAG: hypothetical protein HZB46_12805 [Solirubrobacterales bacterium]|nr:hypothetical protein [Solirubrobacterales bacterium]
MSFGKNLRLISTGAIVTLGIVMAPAAQAKQSSDSSTTTVHVCNQATPNSNGGVLDATDPATGSPAARYTSDLSAMPGKGKGLVIAAAHSPALTECAEPVPPTGGGLGDVVVS